MMSFVMVGVWLLLAPLTGGACHGTVRFEAPFQSAKVPSDDPPKHLRDARSLVENVKLDDTDYVHGEPKVEWKGENGAAKYSLHTDCSGFIDVLLMHSYGYAKDDFRRWFGKARPTANVYHDMIVAEKGFSRIEKVSGIKPGDIFAVKYLTRKDNTGHVMLVAEKPRKMDAKKPFVTDTDQWSIRIIDSSQSGHGTTDTRHKKGLNGKDHTGLGEGVLRVYSQKDGAIAGWSWSTLDASTFQSPKDEPIVIGRYTDGFKP